GHRRGRRPREGALGRRHRDVRHPPRRRGDHHRGRRAHPGADRPHRADAVLVAMADNAPTTDAPGLSGRRRTIVWVLVVLASVIRCASVLTTWLNRQLLDDHSWRNASKQLVQDPVVRNAVSVYLVDQLYQNVDVAAQLEQQFPKNLKPLAGPVSAALRQPA